MRSEDLVQSLDGVAVKGVAGGVATVWLGNLNTAVAILVGLATLVYVSLKIYYIVKDRGGSRLNKPPPDIGSTSL